MDQYIADRYTIAYLPPHWYACIVAGGLEAGQGVKLFCSTCRDKKSIKIIDQVKVVCYKCNHVMLDLINEHMRLFGESCVMFQH